MSSGPFIPGVFPLGLFALSMPPLHNASATFNHKSNNNKKKKKKHEISNSDAGIMKTKKNWRKKKFVRVYLSCCPIGICFNPVAATITKESLLDEGIKLIHCVHFSSLFQVFLFTFRKKFCVFLGRGAQGWIGTYHMSHVLSRRYGWDSFVREVHRCNLLEDFGLLVWRDLAIVVAVPCSLSEWDWRCRCSVLFSTASQQSKSERRRERERKGKERKGKERKGKERKKSESDFLNRSDIDDEETQSATINVFCLSLSVPLSISSTVS